MSEVKKLRVILIEDDEWFGVLMKRQLKALSAYVNLVQDPKSFLVDMSSETPAYDLAVVDLGLPGLSGAHLISWMRTSVDHWIHSLPILVVTGTPELAHRAIGELHGEFQIIGKPYSMAELLAAIDALLPQRQLH